AGCAVEGERGSLGAHDFEVEGAQATAARFLEHAGEDRGRYAGAACLGRDIELLDPERFASLLDRDDLIRQQDADGFAVALGDQQPGRSSGPEGRVAAASRVASSSLRAPRRRCQGQSGMPPVRNGAWCTRTILPWKSWARSRSTMRPWVITGQHTSPQESSAAKPAGSGRGGKYDS